jgi:polysaccharide deacetylase family protein (PEP-CTERM system associated)
MAGGYTFTCDVEAHRPHGAAPLRFPDVTRRILEWLCEREIRGTFFVVGLEAEAHPDLVADIAAAGQEVALHGYRHVPLRDLTPEELAVDLARGRSVLEQAAQIAITGFRAPQFSLTEEVPWAHEVIAQAGFTYSSSVLPAPSPLFGYPDAPTTPFRWPSGLFEFTPPLMEIGSARLPIGGVYLRVLPWGVLERLMPAAQTTIAPWMYSHPYDFDPGEPFHVVRDANPVFSPLQWIGRRFTFRRTERILGSAPGAPLGERVGELADVAVFNPR